MTATAGAQGPAGGPKSEADGGDFADTLVGLVSAGVAAHQAGELDAAEDYYRRALAVEAGHPHALHLLGVVRHQKGDHAEAVDLIRRSLAVNPDFADAHSNLGAALFALDRKDEAAAHFRRAGELNPALAEAHSNLAAILMDQGRIDEAIESYRAAHDASPATPRFIKRLGDLYLEHEQFDDAIDWFGRFLAIAEDDGEVSNNMAYAFERLGRLEDAEIHYRRAVELCPASPEINNNLGSVLGRLGKREEADEYFRRALEIDPAQWQDLANLAGTYVNRRETARALPLYAQLVEAQPDNAKLHNDYAVALSVAGCTSDAEAVFTRAIEIDPDFAEAYNNLGSNLLNQGRRAEAIEQFKRAIEKAPRYLEPHINISLALAHENRLDEAYLYARATVLLDGYRPPMFSNPHKVFRAVCDFDAIDALGDPWDNIDQTKAADYSANFLEMLVVAEGADDVARLAALHRKWGRDVLRRVTGEPLPPVAPRARDGKLRLGFMSSDLRRHSVAKFVLPLLEHYDRERFEIICYSPSEDANDAVQRRIKSLVAAFRVIDNRGDREFAEKIREDEIDILFELNGFTRDTRLKVLAYKPAPVQIYWLGYPFTTGIEEVDYIILDDKVKPVNDDWLVETPLLMPESWVCFEAFAPEPISAKLPVERNGVLTFGSQNNPYKITRNVVALWARVMNEVPDSRFLLVRPECSSMVLCNNLTEAFGRHGIGPERLFFVNNRATALSHLAYYDEIDVSLDTFPLTGGTTTCDAMWMGVPVVSLVGPGLHQRLSNSLLRSAELGELCVESEDAYVAKAVELAANRDALHLIRHSLRPMLLDSPLCQAERFAAHFQDLLEDVARRHELR